MRLHHRLLWLSALVAGSCAPVDPQIKFNYAEKRAKLDNGLRLVVMPDKSTPLVEVDVRYEVGSNEDPPGKAGLAHLVEHMMFQKRPWGPDGPAMWDVIPQIAVAYNAYTNWDQTHYMLLGRRENLETLLNLEASRMGFGCDTIPDAQFARERDVVRNEIRGGSDAEGQIPTLILEALYPEGHPYRHTPGGDDQQIAGMQKPDVCEFMDKYYVPSRATVIVAGNVDPEEVGKIVRKYFDAIEPRSPAPRTEVKPIDLHYKRVDHTLDIERTQVHVAWKLPASYTPDDEAARFMINAVTGRVAGFAEDWDFASAVYPQRLGGELAPTFVVSVELRPGHDVDEALEYIWKSARGAHRRFESGMFDRSKKLMKANFIRQFEPLFFGRCNLMGDLVQFDKTFDWNANDNDALKHEFERIDHLDGGRMRSYVEGALDPDKAVVVVIHAKKGAGGQDKRADLKFQTSTDADRKSPVVDPGEARKPLEAPGAHSITSDAKRFTLDNGMRVVLLPVDAFPIVTAELLFDVGSAQESASMAGLAATAAEYLNPPIGSRYGDEEVYPINEVGGSLSGSAGDDTTTFVAAGMNNYLDVYLNTLERMIKVGDYEQEAIERGHKDFKIALESKRFREGEAFDRELYSAVFGPNHPYTTNGRPTRATIGKLGRDAAAEFKSKHYSARNATLVIAGNFDPKQAEQLARDVFGDWSGGHKDEPVIPAPSPRQGPVYTGVISDDNRQYVGVQIAYPAPGGVDGQQAARLVLTEMLNSRVGKIRETLGSTYGVYARRANRVGPTMYEIGGTVDAERAGESLIAMRKFIDDLRTGYDDFDADFARARREVMSRLLAQSTESRVLASYLAQIAIYNLPPDYFDKLVKYVSVVSPAQIRALVEAELRPETEVIVSYGDKAHLQRMYAETGLEDVKYVDVE